MKTYVYKFYNEESYLGDVPDVISDFSYSQDINTGGAAIEIVFGRSFDDVGATQVDTFLVDEAGNKIIDEAGNYIVTAKTLSFSAIPIALANEIKVYMFDEVYPNGLLVFDGLISRWNTSYTSNTISITVLCYGVRLDNYVVSSIDSTQAIIQDITNTNHGIATEKGIREQYAQGFNLASDTIVGSFEVYCQRSSSDLGMINWGLYYGTPLIPGSLIDSGSLNPTVSAGFQTFQLTVPFNLLAGNYFILFYGSMSDASSASYPIIYSETSAPYAGGSLYYRDFSSTSTWTDTTEDLTFIINASDGTQNITFTAIDPGQIARTFIDQISNQGSLIDYSDTIDLCSTVASYDFKIATGLEGMNKALSLAPDGWYWYFDKASNYIHFHNSSSQADHNLTLGDHFIDADITYSLESTTNSVYFSGGDTGGGQNLYSIYISPSSIAKYGKWTKLLSDNRVTNQETADLIGNGELNHSQMPVFQIKITVDSSKYDIETFNIGEMVGLQNFDNLLDTIVYQIVRIERNNELVTLTLGDIPPRSSNDLYSALRRLDSLETINN